MAYRVRAIAIEKESTTTEACFGQSQTALSLTKFLEKSSNIFNPRQIYYKNIFNY